MPDVLSNLDDLTPEWLTETLHREGHLPAGEVKSIDVTTSKPTTIAFLDVAYSDNVPELPTKRFLKFASPDSVRLGRLLARLSTFGAADDAQGTFVPESRRVR